MSTHHDVIVVGAGLAGLRCANDLVASGRDPLVLEARDRVGGRVWSHRFANGQWAERGAEFVDSAHLEVHALAEAFGLEFSEVRCGVEPGERLLDVGGRTAPFKLHHSLTDDLARFDDAIAELAALVDPDHTDGPAGPAAAFLDDVPLSALVEALGLSLMARVVIGRDVRSEYMLAPDQVSQLMAAWMTSLRLRSGDGIEGFRIVGGNDQLATGLAARLDDRVRLGTSVAIVEPDDGAVVLGSGERLTADHLVVTVPLPVLGRVWQDVPAALTRVGYGIGGKVSIQFGRRVWRDYGRDGSVRTERAWGELWETSDDMAGDTGVMTALLSSNDGAALMTLPDLVDRVVAEIERIFPGSKGLVGEHVVTDWTDDVHSLGAYATFGVGQLLAAWPLLRATHGRMVLAGEHTDEWCGFMEGALRSGARAARTVLGS
jgi:monoamine oxidase